MNKYYGKETSINATHWLKCKHCIGLSCYNYCMSCIPLKEMPGNRIKIIVFGDRYWKGNDHIKHIRYVPKWKVIIKNKVRECKG